MKVTCPSCGKRIPAEDINLDRMVAKCRLCNTVFGIGAELATESSPVHRRRAFVGLPERMKIVVDDREVRDATAYRTKPEGRGDLVITRRWFEAGKHVPLVFFCLFWDGFLANWYRMLLRGSESPGILFYVFPLIHVTVGVGLTYSVIAGLFNTTHVGIRGGDFFVKHGPIPWRGSRTIPAQSITQLFVEEKVNRSNDSETRTYNLSAILDGGERMPLVKGLPQMDQALFLEQALEERLGIVDVAVAGEMAADLDDG